VLGSPMAASAAGVARSDVGRRPHAKRGGGMARIPAGRAPPAPEAATGEPSTWAPASATARGASRCRRIRRVVGARREAWVTF
jgi:hypothetical protein